MALLVLHHLKMKHLVSALVTYVEKEGKKKEEIKAEKFAVTTILALLSDFSTVVKQIFSERDKKGEKATVRPEKKPKNKYSRLRQMS
jgi:hypothetical protein